MLKLFAGPSRFRLALPLAGAVLLLAACDPDRQPGGAYYDGVLWNDYYWDRCPPYCGGTDPGEPEDPPKPIQPLPPERPVQPLPRPTPPVARPLPARPPISRPSVGGGGGGGRLGGLRG
jgi:hypothetical protein